MATKKRCAWGGEDPLMIAYHDDEWGMPVTDDHHLFEMLTLEGAQAGLSWRTILHKREGYRKAFVDFDPARVARFTAKRREKLLDNPDIVRNRLKVESTVVNANAVLAIQKEHGSLARYLWGFVDGKPIVNEWKSLKQLPAKTELSDHMSKALKKDGFKFVGSTVIYAFLQAAGFVNDHTLECFCRRRCITAGKRLRIP